MTRERKERGARPKLRVVTGGKGGRKVIRLGSGSLGQKTEAKTLKERMKEALRELDVGEGNGSGAPPVPPAAA